MMRNKLIALFFLAAAFAGCTSKQPADQLPALKVSDNGRYLSTEDGKPFFWLGDTGWLLFTKLNREEAEKYLDDRQKKGFNVIQVMVLHSLSAVNVYGDSALNHGDVAHPVTTEGNTFADSSQYDYWDQVDFVIDQAAKRGIYMALVPIWGTNVKEGHVSSEQAGKYARFLAERYKDKPNVIWVNGGDIKGSDSLSVWNTIGKTLNASDPNHLISFHPRGRTQSSEWFQDASWLDFNMFQSGHRRYNQDTSANEKLHYGEDNWKYVLADYQKKPVKPTLDAEPSYEGIPQGLHDTLQPLWKDNDVRRYAYWSVFAGACGFTYGDNAVMQFHRPSDKDGAYGAKDFWFDAINDPGSGQMVYLKKLMLSKPYFERIPDQSLIANQGDKYNYLAATRGKDYAFVYTYNGRNIQMNMGKIAGDKVKASWYDPRTGKTSAIGTFTNQGTQEFNPPGEQKDGNDWVLVVEKI